MLPTKITALGTQQAVRGFSLVEISLAIGVMAFGLVSILGLMPVGLTLFKDTMKQATVTKIVENIAVEARQTDFDDLKTEQNANTRWFNAEGNRVTEDDESRIFYVSTAVNEVSTIPGDNYNSTEHLYQLEIQVAYAPEHPGDPLSSGGTVDQRRDLFSHFIFIANGTNSN